MKKTNRFRFPALLAGAVVALIGTGCAPEAEEAPVAQPAATAPNPPKEGVAPTTTVSPPPPVPGVDPKVNQTIQQDFKDAKN